MVSPSSTRYYQVITEGYASLQSDMDVIDEKANGGPPLEVEEIVSVKDGKSDHRLIHRRGLTITTLH